MRSVAFALLFVFIAVTSFAAVPRLIMPSDDGGDAVVLSAAVVRVTIRGHLARTEYELTFRNRSRASSAATSSSRSRPTPR